MEWVELEWSGMGQLGNDGLGSEYVTGCVKWE